MAFHGISLSAASETHGPLKLLSDVLWPGYCGDIIVDDPDDNIPRGQVTRNSHAFVLKTQRLDLDFASQELVEI